MFRTCCLLVVLFITRPAYAQQPVFQWAKRFVTSDYLYNNKFNMPRSIAVDAQGKESPDKILK